MRVCVCVCVCVRERERERERESIMCTGMQTWLAGGKRRPEVNAQQCRVLSPYTSNNTRYTSTCHRQDESDAEHGIGLRVRVWGLGV